MKNRILVCCAYLIIALFNASLAMSVDCDENTADAMLEKGISLVRESKRIEAFTLFNEIIERFGSDDNPKISTIVTVSEDRIRSIKFNDKDGRTFVDRDGELQNIQRMIESLSSNDNDKGIYISWILKKADLFLQNGYILYSFTICDDILAEFSNDDNISVVEQIVKTMLLKASVFLHFGGPNEKEIGITYSKDIIEKFGHFTEFPVQVAVAEAMLLKATMEYERRRKQKDALDTLSVLFDKYTSYEGVEIKRCLARALSLYYKTLSRQGRITHADLSLYDAQFHDYQKIDDSLIINSVAEAYTHRILSLLRLGLVDEAVSVTEEFLVSYHPDCANIREELNLEALLTCSLVFQKAKKYSEAIGVIDCVINRCLKNSNIETTSVLMPSFLAKGNILEENGKFEEAIETYTELLEFSGARFSMHPHVIPALANRARLHAFLNDKSSAVRDYEAIIDILGRRERLGGQLELFLREAEEQSMKLRKMRE